MALRRADNPSFPSIRDIKLYLLTDGLAGRLPQGPYLSGSSLLGRRTIADFFKLIDHLIQVTPDSDYQLQKIDDRLTPLTNPPLQRLSPGHMSAGNYLILSLVEGGRITFKPLQTSLGTDAQTEPPPKRVKFDEVGSTTSQKSSRDRSDDPQSFKMRLVSRDKGCVICLATGKQAIYMFLEDSNRFEGGHIIDFAYQDLWDARGFAGLVKDPFTNPANADNKFASPSTRTKKDTRRINPLDNGMLFCLEHHNDYDNFRIAIHPETHKIFSFYPATAVLHGVEVTAPWSNPDEIYPPPLPAFLEMHYFSSIVKGMKGGGDDDDDDYEELAEPDEVGNDAVKIWLSNLPSDRQITSSFSFTADKLDNLEALADVGGVVSV